MIEFTDFDLEQRSKHKRIEKEDDKYEDKRESRRKEKKKVSYLFDNNRVKIKENQKVCNSYLNSLK